MSHQQVSLPPKLLLAAVIQNLDHHFFGESRESAKIMFQAILKGEPSPFMKIDTGESGDVFCELSLDTSLYVGKLNFSKFRNSLAMMMVAIKERLQADAPLNPMNSEQGDTMFNIPGIVKEADGQFNVMVASFRQLGPGLATVRLLFLDPDQYAAAAQLAAETASAKALAES